MLLSELLIFVITLYIMKLYFYVRVIFNLIYVKLSKIQLPQCLKNTFLWYDTLKS